MKIFLTGATGFIGAHVARLLLREGCTVYALIRPQSNVWRISPLLPSLQVIHADLSDHETLGSCLKEIKPDLAIHLAWYAVPGEYVNSRENLALFESSVNLAIQLAASGCKKMVVTGTCFEYDTTLGYLSESSPTKPRSLYGAAKLALQLVLEQLSALNQMPVTWVRLFYQYGPYEDKRRLVPSVIYSLLNGEKVKITSGDQVRDFLHVEDVAAAIWAIAQSNLTGPVNIGSGKPVTIKEIVTQIAKTLNRLDLINFAAAGDDHQPMIICANNGTLTRNTAWKPKFNLEQGLQNTIDWWKSQVNGKKEPVIR